jgi:hypothetical protein
MCRNPADRVCSSLNSLLSYVNIAGVDIVTFTFTGDLWEGLQTYAIVIIYDIGTLSTVRYDCELTNNNVSKSVEFLVDCAQPNCLWVVKIV